MHIKVASLRNRVISDHVKKNHHGLWKCKVQVTMFPGDSQAPCYLRPVCVVGLQVALISRLCVCVCVCVCALCIAVLLCFTLCTLAVARSYREQVAAQRLAHGHFSKGNEELRFLSLVRESNPRQSGRTHAGLADL